MGLRPTPYRSPVFVEDGGSWLAFGRCEACVHNHSLSFPSAQLAPQAQPWLCAQGSVTGKSKRNAFHTGLVIAVETISVIFRAATLIGEGCFLENIAFKHGDSSFRLYHWAPGKRSQTGGPLL